MAVSAIAVASDLARRSGALAFGNRCRYGRKGRYPHPMWIPPA